MAAWTKYWWNQVANSVAAAPRGAAHNALLPSRSLCSCTVVCSADALTGPLHGAGLVIFNDTMFVATGNGGFDPSIDQYGDSVLHLSLPDLAVRRPFMSYCPAVLQIAGRSTHAQNIHPVTLTEWPLEEYSQASVHAY